MAGLRSSTRSKISVAPLGRPAKPLVFTDTGLGLFGSSAVNHFEKWLDEKQHRVGLFSAAGPTVDRQTFADLQQSLSKQSISHGFDLVDADQVVLHPERGAVP